MQRTRQPTKDSFLSRTSANNTYSLIDNPANRGNGHIHAKVPEARHDEQSTRRSPMTQLFSSWWKEILACLLMLGMLFAIVGVLYPHQGRPLPEWKYGISINALISVFSTVLKATSISILAEGLSQMKWLWFSKSRPLEQLTWYDGASRSILGCLRLVFVLNWRDAIATVGAITAILSVAVDPFTQQLVHYYNCQQTVLKDIATVPRTQIYGDAAGHTSAGTWPVATQMYAYIDQGLFNPKSVQTPFDCPTGNCTFSGTYSSVGWCASCKDVTDQLTFSNVSQPMTIFDLNTNQTQTQEVFFINSTLPSGTYASYNLEQGAKWFTIENNITTGNYDLILAAQMLPGSSPQQQASIYDNYFAYLSGGCHTAWQNATWGCQNYGAATCRLDPCVRTYEASVKGGKVDETTVAQYTNMYQGMTNLPIRAMADASCVTNPTDRERLRKLGINITDTSTMIPYPVAINSGYEENGTLSSIGMPILNGSDLNLMPPHCIYDIEYPALESMTSYLSTYLSGYVSTSANEDSFVGDPQQIAIFNNSYVSTKSINDTFQSMAESISLRMRTFGYPSLPQFTKAMEGTVQRTETCVNVKWPFLIEPAIVVGLTLLFFIAMVARTEGRHGDLGRGWKSSALPLVLNGLEGVQDKVSGQTTVREMERLGSGNIRIRRGKNSRIDEG